jgi:hypothetical protein
MIGAARLDVATYESVERDVSANGSALLVVVLTAIAAGIGSLLEGGLTGLVGGVIVGVLGWILYAGIAYFVGTTLLKGPNTRSTLGEVLRTLGFAQSPRILLALSGIPVLGWLISFVVFLWVIATTVVALRQALDVTTGRAIGTAIIALVPFVVLYGVLLAIIT